MKISFKSDDNRGKESPHRSKGINSALASDLWAAQSWGSQPSFSSLHPQPPTTALITLLPNKQLLFKNHLGPKNALGVVARRTTMGFTLLTAGINFYTG